MDPALTDTFRRIYSAVQRGDTDALQAELSHDIEWTMPDTVPWGGTHHGHLGVAAMREIHQEHVDGIWADPDEMIEVDDTVVVLGRTRGRGRASGDEFEVPFAHVWRMTEGVPSSLRGYFDAAPIAAALGGAG